MQRNTTFLKGFCTVLPAAILAAAHWFPWHKFIHRDLGRLEAYAIGTAAIVGTAGFAISISDGDRDDHAVMLVLSALAAGGMTVGAYAIDDKIKTNGKLADLSAQLEALKGNGNV